jgi:hypothetical protein
MENPIIDKYRGVVIRKYNTIKIRVSVTEYKRFIDAKKDLGLSVKEAIKSGKVKPKFIKLD